MVNLILLWNKKGIEFETDDEDVAKAQSHHENSAAGMDRARIT